MELGDQCASCCRKSRQPRTGSNAAGMGSEETRWAGEGAQRSSQRRLESDCVKVVAQREGSGKIPGPVRATGVEHGVP